MKGGAPEGRDWDRINSLGLYPGIETPADYQRRVEEGVQRAKDFLRAQPDLAPSAEIIQKTHHYVFEKVHPWAGQFRGPDLVHGHSGEVFAGGMNTVNSQNIPNALQLAQLEFKDAVNETSTTLEKAEAIAVYHHRFERCHPFLDGNGRVGRLIMDEQSQRCLGAEVSNNLDRDTYQKGLFELDKDAYSKSLRDHIIDATGAADRSRVEQIDRSINDAETTLQSELAQKKLQARPADAGITKDGPKEHGQNEEAQQRLQDEQRQQRERNRSHDHGHSQ